MAFVHDNIISGDLKPINPEKVDKEKTMPDVEIAPATKKNPTTTTDKEQAQAIVHDSASNSYWIQEEILALKRKKPIEALERLQILCMLSTSSKFGHSSDASLADTGNESVNLLIQQWKDNIFESDLLNAIEGDSRLGTDIRQLLVELSK